MNKPKAWLTQPGGLAEQLRAIHDATGLSGKDFAERLGWAPSKVSRIRSGIITPSRDDLAAWVEAAGNGSLDQLFALHQDAAVHERTFKDHMAHGQAEVQRDYNDLVRESQVIRYFDTVWIPGFLQTREYARAVFKEMIELHHPIDDVDEAVAERMQRQQLLYDQGRRFDLLIAEPALLWDWVPARVMVPQLHFLATWLDAPNVRLGILPMRGGNVRAPQNSFQMYDDLVIVESFGGEDDQQPPKMHAQVMDELWERAAVGEEARTLIGRAIRVWES